MISKVKGAFPSTTVTVTSVVMAGHCTGAAANVRSVGSLSGSSVTVLVIKVHPLGMSLTVMV